MLADAKITDPSTLKNSPLTGALKLITTNGLCIGYAGSYNIAIDAIRNVRSLNLHDKDAILDDLLNAHIASDTKTDFIIATYSQHPELSVISNGSIVTENSAAWIGDPAAFSEYQRHYHNAPVQDVDSCMSFSMEQLIREGQHASVGDFKVTVRGTDSGFRYCTSTAIFPIQQTIPSGQWTTIQFGSAQQGGYAYSVMTPLEPNAGAIGAYFFQGRVGALYHPIRHDRAIIYSDVDFEEFKDAVFIEHGLRIDGAKVT
jgi:hypothetical protein